MIQACTSRHDSFTHELAYWLFDKRDEHSVISKIQYHLAGRTFLLGASLISLSEGVTRVAIGGILSCRRQTKSKSVASSQIQQGIQAGTRGVKCLFSIIFPTKLATYLSVYSEIRSHRVVTGTEVIARKLQREFAYAQTQAAKESPRAFSSQNAPSFFKGNTHAEKVGGYPVGVCSHQGQRLAMEDEHLIASFKLNIKGIKHRVQLFGIFDGHGGPEASLYVKGKLKGKLKETLLEFCAQGLSDASIWNALKITFVKLHEEFTHPDAGTTATITVIMDKKLWTANVGDSRAILDNGIQLSEDAKPTDPRYKKGIVSHGGRVIKERINGCLNVARAVGDHALNGVNPRPKITAIPLSKIPPGSHLILACDGIYEVASTKQIAKFVRTHKDQSADKLATNIAYSAFHSGSSDNLSALVVKLQ